MSFKTTAQLLILLIIAFIIGFVYYNYFSVKNSVEEKINENEEKIVNEQNINTKKNEIENEEKIIDEQNINTKNSEIEDENTKKNISNPDKKTNIEKKDLEKDSKNNNQTSKEEIANILTEVEYLTIDNKGNKYRIFANSGITSKENKDVLELDKVRGIITSEKRSTIYIVSDFAKYNSSNQNSHFYENVVINFEDKEINCNYFDINMQTSLAIAYGNVIVTDPKSIMKAGKITLDIKTKDINIEPGTKKKIKIETD